MPAWRGTFIVPVAARWAFKRYSADATSASLRKADPRRGTLVVPAEAGWMIKRNVADATSASLRCGKDQKENEAVRATYDLVTCFVAFSISG